MMTRIYSPGAVMLLAITLVGGSASAMPAPKPASATKAGAAKKTAATPKAKTSVAQLQQAPAKPAPPRPARATTGTLKAPYDEFSLTLLDWSGTHETPAEGKEGVASVAPGNYWITGWQVHMKDKAGHVWRATGGCMGQPQMGLRVSAGSTNEIRLATPLRIDMTIDQVDTEFAFLMRFLGTGGDRCTRVYMDGVNPPLPKMKIVDAEGNLVTTLEFKYGCGFVCRKGWKAPDDAKWPLTATVEIDFGPFPVVTGDPIQLKREKQP